VSKCFPLCSPKRTNSRRLGRSAFATTGLMHRNKRRARVAMIYSITSSARERIADCRRRAARLPENLNKSRAGARLHIGACSSVANLNAGPIPNAPIPIPNGGASGPIAFGHYVDGSGRNVNGRWLIVAGAARYRRSKQCTNRQATNNAGGYLTTACNRSPGCKRQTKTACDQQTNQKLSHFGAPPNEHP
jgi:hypothetical protein